MNYQYAIRAKKGNVVVHTDPMAQRTEAAPPRGVIVYESRYQWGDDDQWLHSPGGREPVNGPMSVYEVHLGSWRQGLTYLELAEHLVNYVKDLGFTHVELLPVAGAPVRAAPGATT